jgi:cytochrome d ubiquinol oxidase subunit II
MTALQITWFLLIGLLLTVYAILDGFDLGLGFWHLFAKKDEERRMLISAVGPVWDGNEVWLLTGGGAIFAAFPPVYATVFSGFYLALMLLLLALIFRAVSVEFRSKVESSGWRRAWDTAFGLGSSLAALLFGVALGNLLRGLPLDAEGNFQGSFFTLLNPYALMIGATGFAMLVTHGALYVSLKTSGELESRARSWAKIAWLGYLGLFAGASTVTITVMPGLLDNYLYSPILFVIPGLALLFIVLLGVFTIRGNPRRAFLFSALSIVGLMSTAGASLFPRLVPALGAPELSLTAFNSSSSELTLTTMLILALCGMPLVIAYTIWAHKKFAYKINPGELEG